MLNDTYIELNNKGSIVFVNNFPFDESMGLNKTREELEQTGILTPSIKEPLFKEGMEAVLKYDKNTGLYYEYKNIQKTEGQLQQEEINQLKLENAELMMKSAITDMEIETVKNENVEMMFRLANLEMGGNI